MSGTWANDPDRIKMLRYTAKVVRRERRLIRETWGASGWNAANEQVNLTCRVAARHFRDLDAWARFAWAAQASASVEEYDRLSAAEDARQEASRQEAS